jgi:hypothetical protein
MGGTYHLYHYSSTAATSDDVDGDGDGRKQIVPKQINRIMPVSL